MVKLYEPRLCEGDINMVEMGNGDWVSYEDYAALHALMCRLTDQVNLCKLPDGLYDDLEKGWFVMTDEERAADRKEQDELLDEWYRTEECPYDKR